MPRYDYKCKRCSKQLELKHGFDDQPGPCTCGGRLTKVIKPASITFKGSGFYVTDKA